VKKIGFFITFLAFLTLATLVIAQEEIKLTLAVKEITILSGETETVDLTIKNNQNKADTFSITIFPSFWKGVSTFPEKSTLTIPAGLNSSVKIFFSTPLEAEESMQIFYITVASVTNTSIWSTESVRVEVKKRSPVYISNLTLDKSIYDPEETLIISTGLINVANVASEQYTLETSIEKDNKIVKKFVDRISSIKAKTSEIITNNYTFQKYTSPGKFSVTSVLIDSTNKIVDRRSVDSEVRAVYKLPERYTEKTRSVGFLSVSVTIKVKNEGNVPSPEFYITESLPYFAKNFFRPEVQPTIINKTDNMIAYSWLIPSLKPGDEATVKYHFELWGVWLTILAIIATVFVLLRLTLTPTIIKKYKYLKTLEKEIMVSLDVKNKSMSEIKDILVRDFVPPTVQLIEKFDTVRPKTRKVRAGIELAWNFDLLKTREERVLTYRIKPRVEIVGTLRLPAATMEYVDRKGVKKTVSSGIMIVKPK
jgi:hypothetical protein